MIYQNTMSNISPPLDIKKNPANPKGMQRDPAITTKAAVDRTIAVQSVAVIREEADPLANATTHVETSAADVRRRVSPVPTGVPVTD